MSLPLAQRLVVDAVGVAVVITIVSQLRKPTSWPGRLVARSMNRRHGPLTAWGLSHIQIANDSTALDVGCGGGRTIERLAAAAPEGKVFGIDYASGSVAASRRHNATLIARGQVEVQQASVSNLPFPADTFDVVTAVETHYYWPDLPADVREVHRVLKPGGTFALIAETYKGRRLDWVYRPTMKLLRATYLDVGEHRELLTQAGFAGVDVHVDRAHGWICAVGRKA